MQQRGKRGEADGRAVLARQQAADESKDEQMRLVAEKDGQAPPIQIPQCERISVQLEKKVSWNYQSRSMSLTETWSLPPGTNDEGIRELREDRIRELGKTMLTMLPSPEQSTPGES